jgi:hypothetical protein
MFAICHPCAILADGSDRVDTLWPSAEGDVVKQVLITAALFALGQESLGQESVLITNPFVGVRHEHILTTVGTRPQSVHAVIIDLTADQLMFLLTRPNGTAPQMTDEQTTRAFMVQEGAQIGLNTHFFTLDALPTADLIGLAASDGDTFSGWVDGARSAGINIGPDNVATLVVPGTSGGFTVSPDICLHNAFGVSMSNGTNPRIVSSGIPSTLQSSFDTTPNPRTAAGILEDQRLLLLTVDGRQPGIAEGMTLPELADFMIRRYAVVDAINLDGGGSTTLAMDGAGPRVMNTPVGVGSGQAAVNTERSNGANLAVFARRQYGLAAHRELIAYEGFEYGNRAWGSDANVRPAGGSVNSLNGGDGWASQWNDIGTRWAGIANFGPGGNGASGIAGDQRATALNYVDQSGTSLAVRGGQHRGSFGTGWNSTRQIDTSLISADQLADGRLGKDGTTIWVSFLAQSFNNSGTAGTTQRFAYLQLGDRLRLGKLENSPTGNWGAQDASPGGTTAFGKVPSGQESMFLARIEFRPGAERVSVWLNPASLTDAARNGTPGISIDVADFSFADVSLVGRYSTDCDEIRIGWTFSSVTTP